MSWCHKEEAWALNLLKGLFYQGGFHIPEKTLKNWNTYIRIV